ncbi:protein kinase family protein [Streptomyces sp. NPDC059255]|uniref:protein kinase family protein n=1 Tax=Streptomyces sp. NPDC059255 TaxID=3346793 RepID=UPI003692D0AF
MARPGTPYDDRLSAHEAVAARLSPLSDQRLGRLVAAATPLGTGIGGRSAELDVGGRRVFVKRIPLTETELSSAHARSTANVFGLPVFYQYGVGSAGFGAWRELAVHTMTTRWVLARAYEGFPLMYHWRVLPDSPPEGFVDEFGGVDGSVAHWENSAAVRARLEAIGRSTSSLTLFLEFVPHTLAAWLDGHRDTVPRDVPDAPYAWVADALLRGAAFMSARGLVHFDAHFANVLTDGRSLYFADFGLALSSRFELSGIEARFLADHLSYDRAYTGAHLLRHHLPPGVRGGRTHGAFLRDWIAGRRAAAVPTGIATVLDRCARAAVVLDEFHHRLLTESKRTAFPRAEVESALGTDGSP